jgi:hypothetical protein
MIRNLRPMRRSVTLALVLALVASGAALAAKGDPQKRTTPADQARAKAMLVRLADVPGAKATPAGPDTDFYCKALDESDLTLTGEATGRQLSVGVMFAGSASQVYESVADAVASWTRGTSAGGVRCAEAALRREFAKQGARLVSLRKVAFPRVAGRTAAYRATLSATTSQGDIPLYLDLVALMHSRAQASVVVGSALVAPPRSEEVRLARLVAKRMAAAMRGA